MTDDNETHLDTIENAEQLNQSLKDDDNNNDLSEISLPSSTESESPDNFVEQNARNEDLLPELHDQIEEVLHIDEADAQTDLTKFIVKARKEDYNCLDLSKKNIIEFPAALLEFPSLQYLYLEGNQISELPNNLFVNLSDLKWIDLRNNKITHIPILGLDNHSSLRYLLLGGNLIRTLPVQLGKLKGLSALNLDGNPLEHPPLDVVKQGIKAIQQYLRDEDLHHSTCETTQNVDSDDETCDDIPEQCTATLPDVWASSDEEAHGQPRISRSEAGYYKAATTDTLITHLQSCIHHQRVSYAETRIHRQRAKSDINLPKVKIKTITKQNNQPNKIISNDPVGDVYAARAQEEQRLLRLKHRNMKVEEQLQKVKTKDLLHDWKEDYRTQQQHFRRKRLVKGKDYHEAVVKAPFGIDQNYIPVMNKDQQEMVEKAIQHESRRNRSPESAMREEEERRIRDRQIQERIREITGKIMRRRGEARGNAFEEKRQAELELRELRKLESEIKQRRAQIDGRFKAYTGDVKARKKL